MAALDGALALKERDHVAVFVGENLELDVARLLDELLHVELAVAEGVGRLGDAAWKRLGSSSAVRTMRMPRPPPPALALRMTGIADLRGPFLRFFNGGDDAVGAGQNGHLGLLHRLARLFFFAHEAGNFRRRSDELDIGGAADFSEVGVLTQQAVAGMNRVDVGDFSGGDDGGHIQIAVGGTRRPDADGLVGKANVERVAVGFAVDGDGANAEFPAGVQNAQRNFAAIGNQDLTETCMTL